MHVTAGMLSAAPPLGGLSVWDVPTEPVSISPVIRRQLELTLWHSSHYVSQYPLQFPSFRLSVTVGLIA